MKISVITPRELDAGALARWGALQSANAALASPYFSPGFTQAVGAVRQDARVAVIEDGAGVVGFFPHQARWGRGSPMGGGLSDHHGVVCSPATRIDWDGLLRATGLAYWRFDHLPGSQAPAGRLVHAASPGLDLSGGFDAYLRARQDAGGRRIAELPRKARKMAREVGPLRFEAQVDDRRVFDFVLRLKSHQCRRTGVSDFFSQAWTRELVERLWHTDGPDFAGRLSALWAGDTLVAAHLGLRSREVWHWWFPVYEHAQARHSPGAHLLLAVAETAAAQGHRLLDLGKGDDAYKQSFADTSQALVEGWVSRPSLVAWTESARVDGLRWLKRSRWTQSLRPWVRRWRRAGA